MPYTVDLATATPTRTPYGRWQALNGPLSVTAFGVNAIVLDPGETIDIDHDHVEDNQEEVYVVVSGRVRFRAADSEVEAGPGTVIAVPHPEVKRSYEALEPGTRMVCVGAERPAGGAAQPYGEWIAESAQA